MPLMSLAPVHHQVDGTAGTFLLDDPGLKWIVFPEIRHTQFVDLGRLELSSMPRVPEQADAAEIVTLRLFEDWWHVPGFGMRASRNTDPRCNGLDSRGQDSIEVIPVHGRRLLSTSL